VGIVRLIATRLVIAVVLLLLISLLTFGLLYLSPGSIVQTITAGTNPSPEQVAAIEAEYHLNEPFLVQYWFWISGALHGDFGRSIVSGTPAFGRIAEYAPLTLQLGGLTLLIVFVIGIPVGLTAGLRRGGFFDRTASALGIVGLSAPPFALAILLMFVFGVWLGWFPVFGTGEEGLDRIYHLTLPAVAISIALLGIIVRQTRAAALNVSSEDYISFARARGLSRSRITVNYLLRNVSVPIVTSAGLLIIFLVSGTVLVETVFSLQGLGSLMVSSVIKLDIPVVQALTILIAAVVVTVTLLVDIANLALNPRSRFAEKV
jgi:peptide/nickel transport system permease protein